jgi:glutamate racemase
MNNDSRPIGVFDSGAGGLTVVREIQKQLPDENLIYVGDTARVPYGGRDRETLLTFGRELIGFLKNAGVKAIISACGTTSSNGFDLLRKENPGLPMFDVITPGVEACVSSGAKRAGFIATEATVRSGLFARLINEQCPSVSVDMRACPLFVPLVEEGWVGNSVTKAVAETYLEDWNGQIDALVLGCTHYPLLAGVIGQVLPGTLIIDMADFTVRKAKGYLMENEITNGAGDTPVYKLYATGYTDKLEAMARNVLKGEHVVERCVL